MYNKINEAYMSSIELLCNSVDNEIALLINNMEVTTSSKEFQKNMRELNNARTPGEKWVVTDSMESMMIGMLATKDTVSGIYVTALDKMTYAIHDEYRMNMKTFSENDWFVDNSMVFGGLEHLGLIEVKNGKEVLGYGKSQRDTVDQGTLENLGFVHFFVDKDELFRIISKNEKNSDLFLLNDKKQIVASQCAEENREEYEQLIQKNSEEMSGKTGILSVKAENRDKNIVLYGNSALYDYCVIKVIPYSSYNSEWISITITLVLFVGLTALLSVIVSILISDSITKVILKLRTAMKYTERGTLDFYLEDDRKDEFGDVYRSFNHMVGQLKYFVNRKLEDEKIKNELEISALQYQINPHFLYNLLASIRSLAIIEDAKETGDVLAVASRLFRDTIGYTGKMIPLKDEMENIRRFIYIQNICKGDSIQWNIEMDEELGKYYVPNLIVQPIVENAIFYGTDPNTGLLKMAIHVWKEKDGMRILVEDDGTGISEEKQREIFEDNGRTQGKFSHVGLKNTRERIRLNFGEPYDLILNSDENGTKVELLLPLISDIDE